MKMPWQDRTGLAKAVSLLSTILLISLGLCGINFVAVLRFVPLGGPALPPGTPTWPTTVLSITGVIELISIGISLLGLAVVFAIWIIGAVDARFFPSIDDRKDK